MQGLIGRKVGMTQVEDEAGRRVPVTVIEAGPCVVVQCKSGVNGGGDAVQLGFLEQKEHRLSKAERTRFAKAGVTPRRVLREFRAEADEVKTGDTVTAGQVFEGIEYVDVTGLTKGRGFQGVVKRHRMSGGRMTHGGHSKRRVGAIGQCAYPSRVAKGRRMPGQMGHVRVTQQNLRVVQLRADDNLLLVKGAVPGPNGGIVMVRKALTKTAKQTS